jgi:uncharacterized membrane protein
MTVKLAHFVNIMLYALVAGVMWGTWLALGRTMTGYDLETFLTDGQHMIGNLATIMPVLMIATVVAGVFVCVQMFLRRSTLAGWLALAGVLLLVAVIAITLIVNVPIDNEIKTWTAATVPPNWDDERSRWAAFHTARTFVSLAGLAAAIGSALTAVPATGSPPEPAAATQAARRMGT